MSFPEYLYRYTMVVMLGLTAIAIELMLAQDMTSEAALLVADLIKAVT